MRYHTRTSERFIYVEGIRAHKHFYIDTTYAAFNEYTVVHANFTADGRLDMLGITAMIHGTDIAVFSTLEEALSWAYAIYPHDALPYVPQQNVID